MRLEGWRPKREESWWGRGYGRRAHEVHLLNHQHSHKKHLKSINQNINALRQIVWTVMSWECSGSPGWNPPPTGWGWPCCGCTVHLNLKADRRSYGLRALGIQITTPTLSFMEILHNAHCLTPLPASANSPVPLPPYNKNPNIFYRTLKIYSIKWAIIQQWRHSLKSCWSR